jgi:hypothetical protein
MFTLSGKILISEPTKEEIKPLVLYHNTYYYDEFRIW